MKLQVVQYYLEGRGSIRETAKQFHVNPSDIRKWKDAYNEHGVAGLCTTHGTYTGDFKVAVVEYMHKTGASLRQTAAHFNIPSRNIISKWERIYYEQGREALYIENRGRDTKKKTPKKNNVEKNEDLFITYFGHV